MDTDDFNELLSNARQMGKLIAAIFEGATDEDLNLETALRRYPVVSLSLAAGAGMLGGWWLARRTRSSPPAAQLPPPKPSSRVETLVDQARELTGELKNRTDAVRQRSPDDPLAYLDVVIPGGAERVRELLPEGAADEAAAAAKTWLDSVLEPRLKEGMENFRVNAIESRFGLFVRQTIERLDEQDGNEEPPRQLPG
jgi:hypothetical protein